MTCLALSRPLQLCFARQAAPPRVSLARVERSLHCPFATDAAVLVDNTPACFLNMGSIRRDIKYLPQYWRPLQRSFKSPSCPIHNCLNLWEIPASV